MKNLTTLDALSIEEIHEIIDQAIQFKVGKKEEKLKDKKIANLFFEPSTRTHYSFISAEMNLNMKIADFNAETSSVKKGESLYDTIKTFEAIGFDAVVIRHPENNYFKQLTNINIPILNGGDGSGNHPTQSLLDLMTILEEYEDFNGLKCAIVGDIKHSRVAHTNINVMKRLGMEVYISGPKAYDDGSAEYIDFNQAIEDMDIIMLLRVQHERHTEKANIESYLEQYGLDMMKVNKMKKHAIILHPAPFNRGVEIDDDVVECEKSRIFKQMTNGVYIRMAVLKRSFEEEV